MEKRNQSLEERKEKKHKVLLPNQIGDKKTCNEAREYE